MVRAVRNAPGKPSARTVNRFLRRVFGHALPGQFPSRHVLVVSFPRVPLRLCASELVVDTVVDSWDHPVRRTAGYVTRFAIAWNEDLGRDWQKYQGATEVLVGPPVKLEYALHNPPHAGAEQRTLLYPVATSSHYPAWFAEELTLMASIVRAANLAGWQVLLKPKPESRVKEFEPILDKHENVKLGSFLPALGTLDYHLSPEYNRNRLEEVAQCRVVVNALTTFGLDAACSGAPLIQLDLRPCTSLPTLAGVARNHHLQAHLYRVGAPAVRKVGSLAQLEADLAAALRDEPSQESRAGSANLRSWISQGRMADVPGLVARVTGDA